MTRIDPGSTLLAYIQSQSRRIAALEGKTPQRAWAKSASNQPDDWMGPVGLSVAALAADDPQRRRKAFRIFMEAGLAREFGIEDPKGAEFQRLLDQVQGAMLADERISDAIDRAGELLLQSAGRNENPA